MAIHFIRVVCVCVCVCVCARVRACVCVCVCAVTDVRNGSLSYELCEINTKWLMLIFDMCENGTG